MFSKRDSNTQEQNRKGETAAEVWKLEIRRMHNESPGQPGAGRS